MNSKKADDLLSHADRLHTTALGVHRIKKNLSLPDSLDVVEWCREQIFDRQSKWERGGKNWYITTAGDYKITVNASIYTIITAHQADKNERRDKDMKRLHINASTSYDILIEKGLLPYCGSYIRQVSEASTLCIVTDDTVEPLYAATVSLSLMQAGFRVLKFVFPHGEGSKNSAVYLELLEMLAEQGVTRQDALVALGGGVVGDLTGFAAATYLRGIDFIQIPTTLLACVDSSVGGKTAIDLKAGKNLAGAFYQPILVLCDPLALCTLPYEIYRDGCAEIIKYAMITDAEFFDALQKRPVRDWEEDVIARCLEIKRDVVAQDEFDRGLRALLNFGHTVGHAIEACSEFKISHGHAVALGMRVITASAEKAGLCEAGCAKAIERILTEYGFPLQVPYTAEALCQAALKDKKRSKDEITLILPKRIGQCYTHTIPTQNLFTWIQNGL